MDIGYLYGNPFSGMNALGRYFNGAVSEGLPGILTTFALWFPVAFGVSTLLLAGIRRELTGSAAHGWKKGARRF